HRYFFWPGQLTVSAWVELPAAIVQRHPGELPRLRSRQAAAQLFSGFLVTDALCADVRDAVALGIRAPRARVPGDVCAQRVGRTEPRPLANQDHGKPGP